MYVMCVFEKLTYIQNCILYEEEIMCTMPPKLYGFIKTVVCLSVHVIHL